MQAYNSAVKMKEVPVPFAYVQFNALLLILFAIVTPIAIACFTTPEPGEVSQTGLEPAPLAPAEP